MIYAGIGARSLPEGVYEEIVEVGAGLAARDWTLRSGAADGADAAFEEGNDLFVGKKEIYLPWEGFNGNSSTMFDPPKRAYDIAVQHHPAWHRLTMPQRRFMARNTQQALGEFVFEPCDMVVCYTKDGCEDGTMTTKNTGGTGMCLRLATHFNIPIFNLKNNNSVDKLLDFVYEVEYNSTSTTE